jgi:hypothetical protein
LVAAAGILNPTKKHRIFKKTDTMPITTWTNEFLDQKRLEADPLADDVLAAIVAEKGREGARALFDALIRNVDMPLDAFPTSVQTYLQQTNQLPDWADPQKVERAHALFLDHGPKLLLFLYYKSLPILYACANGAEVLVRTSRLTRRDQAVAIFTRRIAETGQFLMDVMTKGELRPGGKGIHSIQKVRLIHASIRHFLAGDDWEVQKLGQPINQEDMAITLMTFSVALMEGLEQFGIAVSSEDQEAFLHTWAAIGEVLGIQSDLLPATMQEGQFLMQTIMDRQHATSEAGRLLTQALIDFAEKTIPTDYLDSAPTMLMRFLVGEKISKILGLYTPLGCLTAWVPQALAGLFRWGEKLEDKVQQPLPMVIDVISKKAAKAMVGYFDHYKGRPFDIPESHQQRWFGREAN